MSTSSGLALPRSGASRRRTHIYLLGGQGTAAVSSLQCVSTALQDAQQRSNQRLLDACQAAFVAEISSLSPEDLHKCSLDWVQSGQDVADILLVPSYLRTHPVFANVSLYIMHLLRLCTNVPLSDTAWQSTELGSPVFLGFSTGMLAASVFAASSDPDALLNHAVQGLRLAFWLGYNAYLFSIKTSPSNRDRPWSVVLIGCSKNDAAEAVSAYNDAHVGLLFALDWHSLMSDCR